MSSVPRYPICWRTLASLTPYIRDGRTAPLLDLCRALVKRQRPQPDITGLEKLPDSSKFVLAANHHQRPGLWIAHPAAFLMVQLQSHYDLEGPPVHWIVTANWPRLSFGPIDLPSPGDWLLPRVARALSCYPVPFSGTDPARTSSSLLRLLRDAATVSSPIGLFPEGVAGVAGSLSPPMPGISRLLKLLAIRGRPVVPIAIAETDRLVFRIGEAIEPATIRASDDAASAVMKRIAELLGRLS